MLGTVLASVALAAGLGVGLASPAAAADEVTIDHIESAKGKASLIVSADGVPQGTTLDADSVGVSVDDREVNATVSSSIAGTVTRRAVLVLDASLSMRGGGKFESAVTAAKAYLDAAPSDVEIGLVTFSGSIHDEIAPSGDRDRVRTALDAIELGRGTNVFDAMQQGLSLLGEDGAGSLLLLSDGADTDSTHTANQVMATAEQAGVVIDVVSLTSNQHTAGLAAIAESTAGKVVPADSTDLTGVFSAQAQSLENQLLVEFDVPEGVDGEADLAVTVQGSDGKSYSDTALATLSGQSVIDQVDLVETGNALVSKPVFLLGALALALGLFGLVWIAISGPNRSKVETRLEAYFNAESSGTGSGKGSDRKKQAATAEVANLRAQAIAVADRVVSADLETKISQRLTGAGSALTAAEWALLHAAIAVGTALLFFIMGGGFWLFVGLVLGIIGPWIYLKLRHDRRLAKFNGQLAETLGLMAGGLQAGLSLPQAVDTVVREGREPMAGELRRALVEQRLGVDITDALEGVGERMESEDFGWVVLAVRIQREVGGNLAEILHTVADTLREREYLRRQVRALSAEGRLSGYILVALPVLIFLYMMGVNRPYVSLLYTTGIGYIFSALGIFLLILGSWAMSKIAKVEV